MKRPNLAKLLAFWQAQLGLLHWDVKISYYEGIYDRLASNAYQLASLRSVIVVEAPEYHTGGNWPRDVEKSVVHELLHLYFAPFDAPNDGPLNVAEEQAIKLLTEALVALKRKAHKW